MADPNAAMNSGPRIHICHACWAQLFRRMCVQNHCTADLDLFFHTLFHLLVHLGGEGEAPIVLGARAQLHNVARLLQRRDKVIKQVLRRRSKTLYVSHSRTAICN